MEKHAAEQILKSMGGVFSKSEIKVQNDYENLDMEFTMIFSNDKESVKEFGYYIVPRQTEKEGVLELVDKDVKELHPIFKDLEFMTSAFYVDASKGESILKDLPEF